VRVIFRFIIIVQYSYPFSDLFSLEDMFIRLIQHFLLINIVD